MYVCIHSFIAGIHLYRVAVKRQTVTPFYLTLPGHMRLGHITA